jgi:hypothetical protein
VAQAAHAEHADLVARADAMVLERRVGGDAGAQNRRSAGQVQAWGMRTTKCSLTTMLLE